MHEQLESIYSENDKAIWAIQAILDKSGSSISSEEIRKIKQFCREFLENTRVSIFSDNQVPGFKCIAILDHYFDNIWPQGKNKNRFSGVIGVCDDGCLMTGLQNHVIASTFPDILACDWGNIKIDKRSETGDHTSVYFELNQSGIKFRTRSSLRYSRSYLDTVVLNKVKGKIKIENILCKIVASRLEQARQVICAALDPGILRLMRDAQSMDSDTGRWLTGGDGASRDVTLARQQAVRAYPILVSAFQYDPGFQSVIDTRKSLSSAIAQYYNVDLSRVRNLSGLTRRKTAVKLGEDCIFSDLDDLTRDILDLPNEYVPETREGFQKMEAVKEFGKNLYDKNMAWTVCHLSRDGNPWRFADRMKDTSGQDVLDAVNFLARKLFVPAVLENTRQEINHAGAVLKKRVPFNRIMTEVRHFILSHFSPGNLLDFSKRYHRNIARYEDRLDTISSDQAWPGLVDTLDLGKGFIARELTSAQVLKIQGRQEDHCIGGYVSRILSGTANQATLVFSIEKNNEILGTAEISCTMKKSGMNKSGHSKSKNRHDSLCASVQQNRARSNAKPCKDARLMADRIAEEIGKIGIDSWHAYIDGVQQARATLDLDPYVAECGFNPWNREQLEIVWNELSSALPRSMRKAGLDALINHEALCIQMANVYNTMIYGLIESETGNPWDEIDGNGRYLPLDSGHSYMAVCG